MSDVMYYSDLSEKLQSLIADHCEKAIIKILGSDINFLKKIKKEKNAHFREFPYENKKEFWVDNVKKFTVSWELKEDAINVTTSFEEVF